MKLREVSVAYNVPKKLASRSVRSRRCRSSVSGRNLFTLTELQRPRSRGLELRQPADRPQLRRRAVSTEPELLAVGHGGAVRRHHAIRLPASLRSQLALAGLRRVRPRRSRSQQPRHRRPRRRTRPVASVTAACTGLLIGNRRNTRAANGYVAQLGILGREAYNFDEADPRYIGELLAGRRSSKGSPFGGNFWAGPYANIRLANTVQRAVDKVPEFSAEEKAAILGFSKTIEALDLLEVIITHDTNGAVIDTDTTLDEPLGAIVGKADRARRDREAARRGRRRPRPRRRRRSRSRCRTATRASTTRPTFRKFNRAIRARVAVYQKDYPARAHRARRVVPRRHGDDARGAPGAASTTRTRRARATRRTG